MRKLYIFTVAYLCSLWGFGQITFPYSENFDTYIADNKFVDQVTSTVWTTWDNAPGTVTDPIVSAEQSVSVPNSIKITNGNDLIFKLGDLTEGRYIFTYKMYILNGTLAYCNMLQELNGNNSKLGYQIKFKRGEATVLGDSEIKCSYDFNKWFELKTIIDLDTDWCEIYFGGNLVFEFKWSIGAYDTNLKHIATISFFGWNTDTENSEFYFDNLNVKKVQSPNAPKNLTAEIQNRDSVFLSWETPDDKTPVNYHIYRNGTLCKVTTGLSFIDANLYPMAYNYIVKAFYNGEGLSAPVTVSTTLEGGTARKNVLLEISTGTWCANCPAAARGADQLHQESKKIGIIEYHGGGIDNYKNDESISRINYYNIQGFPTAILDGTKIITGGSRDGNKYESYVNIYNKLIDVPTVVDMEMSVKRTDETSYKITVIANEVYKYYTSDLKLRIAVNESNIEESWQSMNKLDFVNRDMVDTPGGIDVNFSENSTATFNFTFTLPDDVVRENCEVVAFIQYDQTKEVVNTVVDTLSKKITPSIALNKKPDNIFIYPNPVENTLYIKGIDYAEKIEIRSTAGQLIFSGNDLSVFKNGFNTSTLICGVYTVIIYNKNNTQVLRFVK